MRSTALTIVRRYAGVIAAGSVLAAIALTTVQEIIGSDDLFIDHAYYQQVGQRFLDDGTYYLSHQLAGPYRVTLMSDVLYPPTALLLFAPLAVLPAVMWWAFPVLVLAACVRAWRPSATGVALMLLLLSWPRAHAAFIYGNTDMWVMAGVAAGLRWGWPAVFITLKPSFVPFALIGVRRRGWWLAALALGAISIAMLPLWFDYVRAMTNLHAPLGYSVGSIPLMLVPVVAWATRQARPLVPKEIDDVAQPAARSGSSRTPSASA